MHLSDHARMLAVAPGGWDRCTCRHCRISGDDGIRRSARTIERRLVAAEIAEAMFDAADTGEAFMVRFVPAVVTEHVAAIADCFVDEGDPGDAWDVALYWEERESQDAVDIGRTCGCEGPFFPWNFWGGVAWCPECA